MSIESKDDSVQTLKERFQVLLQSLDQIEPETTDVQHIDELLSLIDEIEQQVERIKNN
ncbi:SE1561 family protein [Savagea faecisuis]|uniref:SE1561 family protein n=1 Tax=Savagea faecisuis TaxID=1274803 RepID=A0ABW3H0W5_9BACL